ncbi:MAG: hypothetical protein JXA33_27920 [Anaerolineae bacterium]|nr:hypothetical protein [Anaerolineae bacterium]
MERPDLMPRVMKDMDTDMYDFVTNYITSFVKWDLVNFFYENPHTIDTIDNISRYTGRTPDTVRQELLELARLNLLEKTQLGHMTVYALTSDPMLRKLVATFQEACQSPDFRKKVIYHVIRGTE